MASTFGLKKKEFPSDLDNINVEMTGQSNSPSSPPSTPVIVSPKTQKMKIEVIQLRRELGVHRQLSSKSISVIFSYTKDHEAADYLLHRPPRQLDPFENRESNCVLL